jgi:hypothetical protein
MSNISEIVRNETKDTIKTTDNDIGEIVKFLMPHLSENEKIELQKRCQDYIKIKNPQFEGLKEIVSSLNQRDADCNVWKLRNMGYAIDEEQTSAQLTIATVMWAIKKKKSLDKSFEEVWKIFKKNQ